MSVLQKPLNGHWCFNCYHFIDIDDVYVNKVHREYMFNKLEELESPRDDFLVCICLDCVYYRTQRCASCLRGIPLCMFPIKEWFESMPRNRTCIDCTAEEETKDILKTLNNLCASQCVIQCSSCFQYKYVSSFSVFTNAYGDEARKVICDVNSKKDFRLYKKMICLLCRLTEETKFYRQNLKERYFSKISVEPLLTKQCDVTANEGHGCKCFGPVSYAKAVQGKIETMQRHRVDIKTLLEASSNTKEKNDGIVGPIYFLSTMQGKLINTIKFD